MTGTGHIPVGPQPSPAARRETARALPGGSDRSGPPASLSAARPVRRACCDASGLSGPSGRLPRGRGGEADAGPPGTAPGAHGAGAVRVLPVGSRALLVELGGGEETAAFHAEVLRRRAAGLLPGVGEVVPAARTVLLDGVDDPSVLAREIPRWEYTHGDAAAAGEVVVPVRYDGPDLPEVADLWGVSVREAARIHASAAYRVAFCGFAPGFGYLTGLPGAYAVPRRSAPRTAVPAGALALAGGYTGIYPRPSPGGWQLIGTTTALLWDPSRQPAALLSPGTRVRFVPEGP
ncbi:hypothetical protein GCM10023329_46950 [Streptomyces sanyensis]|uniref:Carboxyltransferase domain-containing protein n=1 Tax=Streptomyces sanyensis TaxID=568869 RepID=A0ABP9B6J6_9ACTN